jgi:hypothetical protein
MVRKGFRDWSNAGFPRDPQTGAVDQKYMLRGRDSWVAAWGGEKEVPLVLKLDPIFIPLHFYDFKRLLAFYRQRWCTPLHPTGFRSVISFSVISYQLSVISCQFSEVQTTQKFLFRKTFAVFLVWQESKL